MMGLVVSSGFCGGKVFYVGRNFKSLFGFYLKGEKMVGLVYLNLVVVCFL